MQAVSAVLFASMFGLVHAEPAWAGGEPLHNSSQNAKSFVYTVLYDFGGGKKGSSPEGSLIQDEDGNLYGTTYGGGDGFGTVFELAPDGTETVLYAFKGGKNDGANPGAGLVADNSGNLYGTTTAGGRAGSGTVFEVMPKGKENVLYAFCSKKNCADGSDPVASLILDSAGNLYGTTEYGGSLRCSPSCGTAFKLAPDGTETVLHAFRGSAKGGEYPMAPLLRDKRGNLYGTTWFSGLGFGTVFKLSPDGKETLLHSFYDDARNPSGALIMDASGDLIGTAANGGDWNGIECEKRGCGTVFMLAPDGAVTMHAFNGNRGAHPSAGVVADSAGNYYGTTEAGGTAGAGVLFKLAIDGTETVLWNFCSEPECADGAAASGLIIDKKGTLYGTASSGGKGYHGVVFSLSPVM